MTNLIPLFLSPVPTLQQKAFEWASRGFAVFPLAPGVKIPMAGIDWRKLVVRDEIAAWEVWQRYPQANIGVRCEGLIVVDVDEGKHPGAMASFKALGLPDTLTVATPSGGFHMYFATATGVANSASKIAPGIDIRGVDGYVLAPGSRTAAGEYRVLHDLPVAEAPESLVAACRKPAERKAGDSHVDWNAPPSPVSRIEDAKSYLTDPRTLVAVEGAGGDNTTFAVAAALSDRGVTAAEALDLMLGHWNDRCLPPWEPDDLRQKVANAFRYRENTHGIRAADKIFEGLVLPEEQSRPKPRLRFLADEDAMAKPDWLVKGLLPRVGVGLLAGESRSGKTFWALELAGALAQGHDFAGSKVRLRGGTLIVAAEAPGSFGVRLEALRRGRLGDADKTTLPIAWQAGGKEDIAAFAAEAARVMPERFGVPLRVVVVDTIAAAFLPDNEDDAGEATKIMKSLDAVAQMHGVLVMGVHHYGKTKGAGVRGSSAWTASADVILAVTSDQNDSTGAVKKREIALTKTREGETGLIGAFTLRKVVIGLDEDGEEIAGAVIELAKGATASPVAPGRPPNNTGAAYLRALLTATERAGVTKRISGQELQVVPQDEVSSEFNAIWNPDDVGDPSGAKRHARRRGAENAERLRLAASRELDDGVFCWLTPQGVSMLSSRTF